jgi:hypothetical protein
MKHMLERSASMSSRILLSSLVAIGCFAGTARAQDVTGLSPRERALAAESFATERLWVWQRRLNLEDWKISVAVARASELRPKTLGNIHWDLEKKTAVLHVLDPIDYRLPWREVLDDIEFTVVHELIHLGFAPVVSDLQRSDANRREEEHAVNHMATALLKLERGR